MKEGFQSPTVTAKQVEELVDDSQIAISKIGEKTTLVRVTLECGFELIETSSCVNPDNYDHELGMDLALRKIKDRIWAFEGYRLQWSEYLAKKGE